MTTSQTIKHDLETFNTEIAIHTVKQRVFDYIDVVTLDGNPDELLAVVFGYTDDVWYSNGKRYKSYQHAFTAIGAAIDRSKTWQGPITDRWVY